MSPTTVAPARHIGDEERRIRLARAHLLSPAARAGTPLEVARSMVALHGTDPATVYLAVGARLADPAGTVAGVEAALYEERSLVRMHGMRHTVFVFPSELAATVHASTGLAVAAKARAGLLKDMVSGSDGRLTPEWLAEVEASALAALERRGQATVAELTVDEPRLKESFVYGRGRSYEAPHTVPSRLMRVLGVEGRVVRGRPLGSWTSTQFRWAVAPPHPERPVAEAQSELLRRWLAVCGPATEADLKWWTGWKVTEVRRALAAVGAVVVSLDGGGTGYVLADGLGAPEGEPGPWAALLPGLDPTAMGWQERDWYCPPELRSALFDRSGNIGPTVWWNGRVVGGWGQREGGEVVWRLLDGSGGRRAARSVAAEADRLTAWLAGVRVTPRFRTPLERELAG
ncbi:MULTISPECIES: winged helix DNA-binding domain-containing protein [unclassified Streptomyces]|uniref:winged helix DNA-binding domain-containing protein n=1 Tax=unclassified Streptomyces TaxID=2593676 RepID=UPI000DBAC9C4|nr:MULTISPECIES: winged helix DNA-binding domain-containing protein [unclassified Streptomyces]MYT70676.1 winged helix DNA-binding domain-containing protein [Streptomyces sp. SID8367]RAJ90381.1 winged helix DNA-binding protein [Streptomyces sp. PsTaAH-137]